ncbi:hypothetical protein EJP617_14430 [Erwinia sp. Ejp617]|nr:hypothetical protein EJP617_14430 [Erwinia sp. Ejp617]
MISYAHEKKVTIVCPQGGVYYAFFQEDERPNFEQYTLTGQVNIEVVLFFSIYI